MVTKKAVNQFYSDWIGGIHSVACLVCVRISSSDVANNMCALYASQNARLTVKTGN